MHITEVFPILMCRAVNFYSHMKYLHWREVIRRPRGSLNANSIWLQPTFSNWQATFTTQPTTSNNPTAARHSSHFKQARLCHRASRWWYWGACRFKHLGLSRDASCGRWPRGWAAAARLPPAVVQLHQPQTVGRSAVWQRIDAEKTGSLTYSCLLCLHQIWKRYNNPRSWPDPCECALLCFFPHMGHISSLSLCPPSLSCSLASDNRMSPALPSPMALPSPTPSPFYSLFMWKVFK